ncbi:MAG TPA: BMP family ABC transporter substrate-binding protein [Acidimicrobiales bacterium]|nr:BMP family ABC transporter substrate-binding protein [Acidimicrobiales bacterium]
MQKEEAMASVRRIGSWLGTVTLVLGTLTMGVASTAVTASGATKFKACVVTDTGGINDKSFNASAWKGMEDAKAKNKNIEISYLSSTSSSDYAPNINSFIHKGCGIIVTVGFLMDKATKNASNANRKQKFAIVDDAPQTKSKNVLALQYQTDQGAFLGGYLAAASTKTGTVATYGGMQFPSVTMYMNGFVAGVRYYNKTKGASVKVLGWTPAKGKCTLAKCDGSGQFVGNFTDQTAGQTITANDFAGGADIVFPVAGSVGLGSVAAAQKAGTGHSVMWVDTNGCVSDKQYCSSFIGSVVKGVEPSVRDAVLLAASGKFKGGTYLGTLKNQGTGFTYGGIKVPGSLKKMITKITKGIIAGKISVNPNSYPAS